MKKYMMSFYSIQPFYNKHEVSIYKYMYSGGYAIYLDGEFWTTINALNEFEDELEFIELTRGIKFAFYGF